MGVGHQGVPVPAGEGVGIWSAAGWAAQGGTSGWKGHNSRKETRAVVVFSKSEEQSPSSTLTQHWAVFFQSPCNPDVELVSGHDFECWWR